MKKAYLVGVVCVLLVVCGCASVVVTKTGKGFYPATNADDVEILVFAPRTPFTELATVTTLGWKTMDAAKMHNSLRAKCAVLGADAVVLGASGIDKDGYFWSNGVAIKYKTSQGQ